MDRIEFFHSINYTEESEATNLLISFFDQYMLLYNLIDNIRSVSYEKSYLNQIQFIIDYISSKDAENNLQIINTYNIVNIYGSICCVTATQTSDTSIKLSIVKQ